MPESHEKRQRNRRKQLKRKEKLERRLQRKAEKRRGDGNPLYHTLTSGGEIYTVETDVWLAVLDLALVSGWMPPEGSVPEEPAEGGTFERPAGLELTAEDAEALSKVVLGLVPLISEEELRISSNAFGENHTRDLLERRAGGESLPNEEAIASHELLSGPPKREVERLGEFLATGAISIEAG